MYKLPQHQGWSALALAALIAGLAVSPGCSKDESSDGDSAGESDEDAAAQSDEDSAAARGEDDAPSADSDAAVAGGQDGRGAEGCYDLADHGCDCDTDEDSCADADGIWTPECGCEAGDDAEQAASLFAVPTEVYGADFATSTSYVPLLPSLEVDEVSLDDAKEVNGRASVARVGEYLFIASSSEPVITRYTVAEDGSLAEDGRLNFMNYGVPAFFSIDAWGAVFVDEHKAYIFNGNDGSHIIWDPTELTITGKVEGPDIVVTGYNLESVAVVRGNRMYRIFTFLNYDSWEFLVEPQYLAVYDLEKDELIALTEEARCPQLYSRPFVDEQGDIYFSGWVWTPGLALTADYPAACALRIKDGADTFDEDWQLNFAADVTDGREAGILRYLGDGKALLDVFYHERADIGEDTDAQELSNTPNWRLWEIDLSDRSGGPIEGLDFKAGGYQDTQVDGHTFLMVPNDGYSETTAYEVVDGKAVQAFKIQGSSSFVLQVR